MAAGQKVRILRLLLKKACSPLRGRIRMGRSKQRPLTAALPFRLRAASVTSRSTRANALAMALVKYGLAGRVLLGPKGKPGTISLPAVMQVLDKAGNKVKSDPATVTVT